MDSNQSASWRTKIKKFFYVVIVLIVISALALIYMNYQNSKVQTGELTEQQKLDILKQLGESPSVNLTDQEKEQILSNTSSGPQDQTQLTEEQKMQILQSLGQK